MKILVACEFSGIVRDAFIKRGHDAVSCDLLPTESPGPHYQGDVMDIINDGWDMMIGFPPCTYLTTAANRHYIDNPKRYYLRLEAIKFFYDLIFSKINKIALENPKGIMSSCYRKPDCIIHPFYFGDSYRKETHLWLKNLMPLHWNYENGLFYSSKTEPEDIYYNSKKTKSGKSRYSKFGKLGKNKGKERSIFSKEIAEAMASQWG